MSPSEQHRAVAARFGRLVDGTTDWSAPAPVDGWTALDVVQHLVEWLPGFLAGGGVDLPSGPTVDVDPGAAWAHHAAAVQQLLDGDDPARDFTHPHLGAQPLDQAIDRFYTADVFMHSWDLARATGQDDRLDADTCAAMLAGMRPMDEVLRGSGQFGPAVPVPADASAQDQLIGFIGRDPGWQPPG